MLSERKKQSVNHAKSVFILYNRAVVHLTLRSIYSSQLLRVLLECLLLSVHLKMSH